MPRFLDSSNPQLNELNRIKKKVVADMKKQYSGTETSIATPTDAASALFDQYFVILSALNSAFFELNATLSLTAEHTQDSSILADRFVSVNSAISKLVTQAEQFFRKKMSNNINMFSPIQAQETLKEFLSIQNADDQIAETVSLIARGEIVRKNEVAELILEGFNNLARQWKGTYNEWEKRMEGALLNYKNSLSPNPDVGGTGGDIPQAYSEGSSMTPSSYSSDWETMSNSTGTSGTSGSGRKGGNLASARYDLPYLPRRFL